MLREVVSVYYPRESNPHFVSMITDMILNTVKEHIVD